MQRAKVSMTAQRHLFIAQGKIMRVFQIIALLKKGRFTIDQIAGRFDISERTAYRYLTLIEALELPLEKTFEGKKYFMAHTGCPVCGLNHQQPTTK